MSEQVKGLDEEFCSSCGAVVKKAAEICPKCGVRRNNVAENLRGQRNKVVAGLLAIFLGGFGIHKFYLGRIGFGIVYLLFCWTLIPGIVGFIEGIIYLASDEKSFNAKYNR